MRYGNIFESIHEALSSACHVDLPDIKYTTKDWTKSKQEGTDVFIKTKRRPRSDEVVVTCFNQLWSNTACGYGGMAGQAFTNAYTIVVEHQSHFCVYFGCGMLAYKIDITKISNQGKDLFFFDLKNQKMEDVKSASEKYK